MENALHMLYEMDSKFPDVAFPAIAIDPRLFIPD